MVWTATYPSWIAPCFGHLSLKRGSFICSERLLRFVHARPILSSVLNVPKNSVVQQYRKLVRFHGADLLFADAAIKEIARIALDRGTGARGPRAVVEEVLEGVLFEIEAGVRYVITERTVRGGEAVKQSMMQKRAPLSKRLLADLHRGTVKTRGDMLPSSGACP